MNTYYIELNVELEVKAFNEADAKEYVRDIFSVDEEIKSVELIKIFKNS
jgi:hypothetical protein